MSLVISVVNDVINLLWFRLDRVRLVHHRCPPLRPRDTRVVQRTRHHHHHPHHHHPHRHHHPHPVTPTHMYRLIQMYSEQ